jgi:hypothetical protein
MRRIAIFFGVHTPEIQIARLSVFSHSFNRVERFAKLATSSKENLVKLLTAQEKLVQFSGKEGSPNGRHHRAVSVGNAGESGWRDQG